MSIPTAGAFGRKAVIVTWPHELVELYEVSYRSMVRVAYALLGSQQQAEEVVHDAVVALARHWDTVEHPSAYLRRSVVNGCYGVLRRREVAGRHDPDPPPVDHEGEASLIELRDVLMALPWRQRAVVVLRYVNDLPDDEIAAILGCKRATVRSLAQRGLRSIRKQVAP